MEQKTSKAHDEVNSILAEWNPIGVDQVVASYEYREYVPEIVNLIQSNDNLMSYLEDLLANKLALAYDGTNETHVNDLQNVCKRIRAAVMD